MRMGMPAVLCAILLAVGSALRSPSPAPADNLSVHLGKSRAAATDLEIGGDLRGLPQGSTRYLSREALLSLPQVTYTVGDDSNFTGPTEVSGVLLENLISALANDPDRDLVVAVCDDQYHAHYPHSYLAAHHPLLVLKINGQDPEHWPKDAEGLGLDMGPYLISHAQFKPAFKLLSHEDEAQIPWGVVRLEFRNETAMLGAIAPPGRFAADALVQNGYRIAQQNCLRCHNAGAEGGLKANRPWPVLSAWAAASPERFAKYVRNPKAANPNAQMPPNPGYDDETMKALTAYFRSFVAPSKAKP